jgi:hypothetical protein
MKIEVLMWGRVEQEVSQDGLEAAKRVDSKVADHVVARDRCACRLVAFCDASELPFFHKL